MSREKKKSYINIYYVDKSIDKGSLSRARRLSVSAFSLAFPTCQSSPKPSPSRTASAAARATWENRTGEHWGRSGGTGNSDSGPARRQRLEVGVSVPDGLPLPEERRRVRPAAGGKKVGAWRLGPLARREGSRLRVR